MNGEPLDLDGTTVIVFDQELYKKCESVIVDKIKEALLLAKTWQAFSTKILLRDANEK